jgi:hypothetical protein
LYGRSDVSILKVGGETADVWGVSPQTFTWILSGGAAAIALWIVARFPELAPRTPRGVTIGLGTAILAFVGTPPAIMFVGGLAGALVAALFVVLPGAICIFLAIAWMMLWVIRSIDPHLH